MSDLAAAVRAQPPEWREQVQIGLGLQTLTIDGIPDAAPGEWSPLDVMLIGDSRNADEQDRIFTELVEESGPAGRAYLQDGLITLVYILLNQPARTTLEEIGMLDARDKGIPSDEPVQTMELWPATGEATMQPRLARGPWGEHLSPP